MEKKYDKLIKILQIAAGVFMVAMVIAVVILMRKYHISVGNADQLAELLTGGTLTVALIIIGFTVIKSFALIFPPAVIFVVSGLFFEHLWTAWLVNLIATAASLILPYYLGKFTGKGMMDTLKARFPKIKKIDDFAETNDFAVVFVFKAAGLLPCDLTSLIFGAMNMPFWRYFLAANLGMLPLNLLWTLLGAKGDLKNPLSFLYVLPILIFAIVVSVVMTKRTKKKEAAKAEAPAAQDETNE